MYVRVYKKVAGSDVNFSKAEKYIYSSMNDEFTNKDVAELAIRDHALSRVYSGYLGNLVKKNVVKFIGNKKVRCVKVYTKGIRPINSTFRLIYDTLPSTFDKNKYFDVCLKCGIDKKDIWQYMGSMVSMDAIRIYDKKKVIEPQKQTVRSFNLQVKQEGAPELSSYKDKELLDELVRRGYWWDKMTCTYTVKYPWSGGCGTMRNLEDMNGTV